MFPKPQASAGQGSAQRAKSSAQTVEISWKDDLPKSEEPALSPRNEGLLFWFIGARIKLKSSMWVWKWLHHLFPAPYPLISNRCICAEPVLGLGALMRNGTGAHFPRKGRAWPVVSDCLKSVLAALPPGWGVCESETFSLPLLQKILVIFFFSPHYLSVCKLFSSIPWLPS